MEKAQFDVLRVIYASEILSEAGLVELNDSDSLSFGYAKFTLVSKRNFIQLFSDLSNVLIKEFPEGDDYFVAIDG